MLIMTNSQVGISCFEKNEVFTSPYSSSSYSSSKWLPCFSVAINKKYANPKVIILSSTTRHSGSIFALSSNSGLGGSGVIDKELEFKPSFDDYLKAMELAKIGKEKKQGNKLNRYAAKNDLENKDDLKSSSFERDEDRLERKKIRGDLDQEMVPNAVKRDGLRNGRSNYKNRKVGKFNHELHANEGRVRSVETRKPVGERIGERLLKYTHSPIEQSNVYKTPRPGRAITLRSVETRKPVGERRGERLSKYTHSPIEEQSNVYKTPRPGRVRVSAVVFNDVGHRMRSSNSLERKAETGSFKEFGLTVNENREKLNRNYNFIKVEEDYKEEISPMDRKRRSYRNFTLEDEDNELSVERAAFRTSENLNEVVNRPRVPLREMEERIQL